MPPNTRLPASPTNNYTKRLPPRTMVMRHYSNTRHTTPRPRKHTPIPHPYQSITRQQMLDLHQALLRWLIIGTSPDLWNIQCLNTNIITILPISIPEYHTHCSLLQSKTTHPTLPTLSPPTLTPQTLHHLPTSPPHKQHTTLLFST